MMYNELEEFRYYKPLTRIKKSKLPYHIVRSKWKDRQTGKIYDTKIDLMKDLNITPSNFITMNELRGRFSKIDYTIDRRELITYKEEVEVEMICHKCCHCGEDVFRKASNNKRNIYCDIICTNGYYRDVRRENSKNWYNDNKNKKGS